MQIVNIRSHLVWRCALSTVRGQSRDITVPTNDPALVPDTGEFDVGYFWQSIETVVEFEDGTTKSFLLEEDLLLVHKVDTCGPRFLLPGTSVYTRKELAQMKKPPAERERILDLLKGKRGQVVILGRSGSWEIVGREEILNPA